MPVGEWGMGGGGWGGGGGGGKVGMGMGMGWGWGGGGWILCYGHTFLAMVVAMVILQGIIQIYAFT